MLTWQTDCKTVY